MNTQEKQALLIRYADYIDKAGEAEGLALLAQDEEARKNLRNVARGWRHLAEQVKWWLERDIGN